MRDIERSCWYALFLSIVKGKEASEALRIMGILKEGTEDRSVNNIK